MTTIVGLLVVFSRKLLQGTCGEFSRWSFFFFWIRIREKKKKKPNKREGEGKKKNFQKIIFFNDGIRIIIIKKGIRIRVFSP